MTGAARTFLRDLGRSLNPPEVGGWFMIGFPLLAGLATRPSRAGAALALTGLVAFLLRVPLKQLRAGVRVSLSRGILAAGVGLMAFGGLAAHWLAGWIPFLPLALALPAAGFALQADLRKRARHLGIELAALLFFCAFAAAVAIAGGASPAEGGRLWAQAFLSLGPGFAAVRYQLAARRDPDGADTRARFRTMHLCLLSGLALGGILFAAGHAGPGWLGLQILLYGRAFTPLHRGPAWRLGVLEVAADLASLLLVVLNH